MKEDHANLVVRGKSEEASFAAAASARRLVLDGEDGEDSDCSSHDSSAEEGDTAEEPSLLSIHSPFQSITPISEADRLLPKVVQVKGSGYPELRVSKQARSSGRPVHLFNNLYEGDQHSGGLNANSAPEEGGGIRAKRLRRLALEKLKGTTVGIIVAGVGETEGDDGRDHRWNDGRDHRCRSYGRDHRCRRMVGIIVGTMVGFIFSAVG